MHIIDYVILFISVIGILLVGFLSGKKSKQDNSSKEFHMAGMGINKLQAGFSMAATDLGGSAIVGAIGYCYVVGLSGIWWNLAAAPAFVLVGVFLAKRFHSMDCATLPEYFGKRYNSATRYLSCIMHILASIASLSVQFTVSCTVLHVITGFNMTLSLVVSLIIVVLLTSGGLRTVVNTDSLLFVIIVLSILAAVPTSLDAVGGFQALLKKMPDGFLQLNQLGVWTPLSWVLLCTLSYSTKQSYVQRMVSAKDEGTAVFGALFTAAFYIVISFALGVLGLAAYVLLPDVTDTNTIFPLLLVRCFPTGWMGLGLAAVFAATISTGTSILHSTATLIVTAFYKPLMGSKATDKAELMASKISVYAVALFSLALSLRFNNIIDMCYVGGLFYAVSVFMPMVFGLYSRSANAKGAFFSIVITVVLSLIWEYFPAVRGTVFAQIPANFFGIVVSTITLCFFSLCDRKKRLK